jgi:hypothetical protein
MARRVTVNVGFITNSSSCVYYFPKEVLNDPEVQAFIRAHDLESGYIGSDLWNRGACSSFLVTKEQKEAAKRILRTYDEEYTGAEYESGASKAIDPDNDGAYVLYGDEYSDTTHILCGILSNALSRLNGADQNTYPRSGYVTDFN